MADEQTPQKSGLVGTLIIIAIMILVPAICALAVYTFLVKPALAPEPVKEVAEDALPEMLTTVEFTEERATVLTEDPDVAAPLLLYQIAMACKNPETAAVVEENKAWFRAKLLELHSNRTRDDLKDTFVKQAILRQAKIEANTLLKRLRGEGDFEVIEVMHLQFTIFDL